jgi:hypothetical protein
MLVVLEVVEVVACSDCNAAAVVVLDGGDGHGGNVH